MDLEDLVRASEEIVHGTVVEVTSHWNHDHTMIVTDVHLQVHESILGDVGGEVRFVHPGGVVGALRVEIPGAGVFSQGQEAVLLLSRSARGDRQVTGLTQGRFDVETDQATRSRRVRSAVASEDRGGEGGTGSPAIRQAERLELFIERLSAIVEKIERGEEQR
jgi:hypothetical protein